MKSSNNSARAWALSITLALALVLTSAVLLASVFSAAPSTSVGTESRETILQTAPQSYQPGGQATSQEQIEAPSIIGTCDTAGPVEVEATVGILGPTAYPNLASAIAAINAGTHQGVINIEICASTTETGSMFLNSNAAAPANYTSVTICPLADGLTISGPTVTGKGLIELNGADNVTIDGDNPNSADTNRDLTIQNTAANTVTFTSVIRVALNTTTVPSADNVTIKNLNLLGSATGRNVNTATSVTGSENTTYGILATGGASTTNATTAPAAIASTSTAIGSGATAGNLLIQNNSISTAARAVAVQGTASNFPGLLIQDNIIGNATAGAADQVSSFGIFVSGSTAGIIRRNTVFVEGYIGATGTTVGIDVGTLGSSLLVKIEKNLIGRVRNNNGGSYPAFGIDLVGGDFHVVQNNFITDVRNDQTAGTGSFQRGAAGIRVLTSGDNHKIYHNSVHLCGVLPGAVGTNLIAAFHIHNTGARGMDVRNNIFSNIMTGGNPTQTRTRLVAVYLPHDAFSILNLTLNNNDYVEGTDANSRMAQAGPTAGTGEYTAANFNPAARIPVTNFRYYTSTLNTAGTNDNASRSVDPLFTSCTDLHLSSGSPMIDNAVDIGVTDDKDDDPRSDCVAPDIGADEFIQGLCTSTPTPTPPPPTPTPGPPTPSPTPLGVCSTVITQSATQTITPGNSFACNDGSPNFFHADSSYWRVFHMSPVTLGAINYDVTSVSFGIEQATANPSVGTQPVTVRLYRQATGLFPGGTWTQIATTTVNVPNQTATVLNVPLAVTVPAGVNQVIMEVSTPSGQTPVNNSFVIGSNTATQSGQSYISSTACGITTPTDVSFIDFPNMHIVFNIHGACGSAPTPPPTPSPTPTPTPLSISGTVLYCSNPSPGPVPGVTVTRTGTTGGSTLSNASGNYTFSFLPPGGSYTVTPSKAARVPGSAGINTVDVIAIQRHFLLLGTPLSGCRLTAANVNGDAAVDTVDVIAAQRFFLALSTGLANVGKYQFSPASRSYTPLFSSQSGQNFDTLVFGDVAAPFVE